jgi:hypothetical protein
MTFATVRFCGGINYWSHLVLKNNNSGNEQIPSDYSMMYHCD